jgi:hypothetical protein
LFVSTQAGLPGEFATRLCGNMTALAFLRATARTDLGRRRRHARQVHEARGMAVERILAQHEQFRRGDEIALVVGVPDASVRAAPRLAGLRSPFANSSYLPFG